MKDTFRIEMLDEGWVFADGTFISAAETDEELIRQLGKSLFTIVRDELNTNLDK